MKINATKSGKSLGKCDAYWRRGSGSHVPRTCYDCANFVTDNYGDVQSCMIDTSGLCVDRSNSSTPSDFWLAQANRSYCESNDTSCTTCLEAKPKSFTSLCDGAGGCFCTKQCKDAIRAGVVDDSSAGDWFTPIYLSAAVVAFVTAVWIVYRGRRRTRSAQLQGKLSLFTPIKVDML